MTQRHAAVIGAGLAGLACARALVAAGVTVRVFDKGRAAGGRLATRRAETPDGTRLQFDHGAQYLTAQGASFAAILADHTQPWPEVADRTACVGVPGMSALPRALAAGLAISGPRTVVAVTREDDAWWVTHHEGDLVRAPAPDAPPTRDGPFEMIAIATPHPQTLPLLPPPLAAQLAAVTVAPCWALLAAFDAPIDAPATIRPTDSPLIWAARDSAKPGRPPSECWVAHAGPDWTRGNLELRPDAAAPLLLDAFRALTGTTATPTHLAVHRWRYALVEAALGAPCLVDPALRIGAAGDWCLGPRAEHAWDSGEALAAALLK